MKIYILPFTSVMIREAAHQRARKTPPLLLKCIDSHITLVG